MINAKKIFRNTCLNYSSNNFNELCFKKLKSKNERKNKKTIQNRHIRKSKEYQVRILILNILQIKKIYLKHY